MGYYIQTSGRGSKVEALVRDHNAIKTYQPSSFEDIPEGKALICVVDNVAFEAAGLVYSQSELEAFTVPSDHRMKTWLLMDKAKAHELAGYKEV